MERCRSSAMARAGQPSSRQSGNNGGLSLTNRLPAGPEMLGWFGLVGSVLKMDYEERERADRNRVSTKSHFSADSALCAKCAQSKIPQFLRKIACFHKNHVKPNKNGTKNRGVRVPPSAPKKNLSVANKELSKTTSPILSQLRHSNFSKTKGPDLERY